MQANALKVMDDAVQKQIEVSNAVSTSLPAMNVAVIDSGNPDGAVVEQILSNLKSNNVDALVKNLNKTIDQNQYNDVRKVMVYDFMGSYCQVKWFT